MTDRQNAPNFSISEHHMWQIVTKLCMQIVHVRAIFATCKLFQIPPVVSVLGGSENLREFAPSRFLPINPLFINRPDSSNDFGAIQAIYLLTYNLPIMVVFLVWKFLNIDLPT